MGPKIPRPRGTRDLLPEDLPRVRLLEDTARRVAERAGFGEVRTPLFEDVRLFARTLGEASDVVEKEMFTVPRRGESGGAWAFRPEGTAGAARAYVEAGLAQRAPFQKWWYCGPMFRYERPQKGRERQFVQFGAEVFGSERPEVDAELADLVLTFFEEVGLTGLELRVNTMGDPEDRRAWGDALRAHFAGRLDGRCSDCRSRFERNVFRLLDCKVESCVDANVGAPTLDQHLGAEARAHFEGFLAALAAMGREPVHDPGIVRGLDYYTRTVFEVHDPGLGARSALCGGGRYDRLVEELGGPPTPASGFAVGFTPTEAALEARGLPAAAALEPYRARLRPEVYVVAITDEDRPAALALARELRRADVRVELDLKGRRPKGQFKEASRRGARLAATLGPEERAAGEVVLKDLTTSEEERVPRSGLLDRVRAFLDAPAA